MTELKPLQILVIEDNPADQELIRHYLWEVTECELHVECAPDLATGLLRIDQSGLDAVLLDLNLPDSQGLETCQRVHDHSPTLPLIVLTGATDSHLPYESMKSGAQDFLVKGEINSRLIYRAIRYAIERMETQQARWRDQERIRLITRQLPAIVWSTNQDLELMTAHGKGLLVVEVGEVLPPGITLLEYFKTEDPKYPPVAAHWDALKGLVTTMEFRIEDQDFFIRIEPMYDQEQNVIGTIGLAMNVTDHRRLEAELLAAKHVQDALTPDVAPEYPGFEIFGSVCAAEETGGDYIDSMPMLGNTLGLVVGDVSGHGLGPAFLVVEFRAYLRPLARVHTEISEILSLVNGLLVEDFCENFFITVFFLRLDAGNRKLSYVGAGHCGYILKNSGEWITLPSSGHPLGMIAEPTIQESEITNLETGDLILVITDGISEARTADEDLLGIDHVLELVQENRELSAQRLVDLMNEKALEFMDHHPQKDDMTALVIKCRFDDD